MNNIIEVNNLTKNYHNLHEEIEAIKDITFSLKEGEYLAIIGPSGCGKSTILSILANISKKTSGEIKFKSKDIHLGYMLQEDSLFPWLNILDNCFHNLLFFLNISFIWSGLGYCNTPGFNNTASIISFNTILLFQ